MSPPEDLHPTDAISAYLDGAAEPEERARVEEHLRACARCRDLVDDFRTLSTSVASEEPPPVPSYLATQIRHRIEQASRRSQRAQFRTPFWRSPFALAAAGVAVATLVWLAVRQQMPDPASPPLRDRDVVQDNAAATPSSPPEAKGLSGTSPAEKENSDAIMVHLGKDLNRLNSKTSPEVSKKQEAKADEKARPDVGQASQVEGFNEAREETDGDASPDRAEGYEDALQTEDAASGRRTPPAPRAPPATAEPTEPPDNAPAPGTAMGAGPGYGGEGSLSGRPRKTYYPARGKEALRQAAKEKADAGREALLDASAPGPRSILYETPDATVTIAEEGVITLVQRGYACSVNVAAPAAEGGKLLAPSELETLFNRAASKEVATAAARAEASADVSQLDKEARSKTLTLRNSEGSTIYKAQYGDSPEVAAARSVLDLEAAIRQTVWTRFRSNLEQRCGPIPGSPASPTP
jgi:putative zinc finger protein